MGHKIRRYNDEVQCHICGKTWEALDPHPPACINPETPAHLKTRIRTEDAEKTRIRRRIEKLREQLKLDKC